MKKLLCVLLILVIASQGILLSSCSQKEKFSSYSFDYFDTVTSITGYEKTQEEFNAVSDEIESMLEEYHRLFTIYDKYDGLNNLRTVNSLTNGAHTVVEVDQKIIDMLLFSKEMYVKTDGKVNVAMGSVLSIWHEYREEGISFPEDAKLPPMNELLAAYEHTDIDDLIIDDESNTVFLSDPEMLLDVGAIAKGYAVEMVAQALEEKGVSGYVINVGGNVRTLGVRGDGEKWKVGVENPYGNEQNAYYATLTISDLSLVTSGSYQRFYVVNGKNYNHIIDPDTLMPAEIFISVSVVTESSAVADALSTALFTMPLEEGQALIDSIDGAEAMWVLTNGDIKYSSGFSNYTVK